MSRNLKTLGLAMVAALALSAVAASAAQGANHHLTVPTAPAIITAEDHETTRIRTTADESEVFCNTAKYVGTVSEATNTSVTLTPEYSGCEIVGPFGSNIPATVTVNHCAYVLYGETDAKEDAKTEFECAAGNDTTTAYSIFGVTCTKHITPQTPAGGVHYTQTTNATTGKQDVTVKITVSGFIYHETHPAGSLCPAEFTGTDGKLEGAVTAQGYKEKAPLCAAQIGTPKTTTTPHLTECQGEVQNLELTAT